MTKRYHVIGSTKEYASGDFVEYASYHVAISALQQIVRDYSNGDKGHYDAKMVAGVVLLSLGEELPKK